MPDNAKDKLWNRNFLLLWQGLFASAMGDVVYEIALGFWVLAITGSTALMGTLIAASMLPRFFIAPFAGVIIDRSDRKKIILLMDVIRGIIVCLVGIAAYHDIVKIWQVFVAGLIIGVCGAFFNPAVQAVIPDIVPNEKLMKANSFFNMIYTGSGIVANSAGGFLFQLLGAPLMFLINGISYLLSAFTEMFIDVPKVHSMKEGNNFWEELKDGFRFIWRFNGLKYLILTAAVLNFFGNMGVILFIPLFQQSPSLGAGLYGVAMATFTGGLFIGMIITSLYPFKPHWRYHVFMTAALSAPLLLAYFPVAEWFPLKLVLLFIAGVFNSVANIFVYSVIQMTVPQDMRGKVFSKLQAVASGLSPIAMAIGGILAEFIPLVPLISASFILAWLIVVPLLFSASFKRFINFDPENDTLESVF